MINRLYDCIYIIALTLLVEIILLLLSPMCNAKVINDTCRIKQNVSIYATLQPEINATYTEKIQEINLKYQGENNNLGEHDRNVRKKREISKRFANSAIMDFQQLNAKKSMEYDNIATSDNLQRSNEQSNYMKEEDEKMMKREHDKDEKTNDFVRVIRDVNTDFDKYTDQDERSNLYDDYEAKDVAKRGVLGGPRDYEEAGEDSPMIKDIAAVQEQGLILDKMKKRETRSDIRVKRDQAVLETFDKIEPNTNELLETDGTRIVNTAPQPIAIAKLKESKILTGDPYSYEVSYIEPLKSNNEIFTPNVYNIKRSDSNDATLRSRDTEKIEEPINVIASPKEANINAEYDKRVEEQIQEKIDSIKKEIQRDIETQRRIRDIRENNARFDELQDQEYEDEEGRNFENDSIERRQNLAKRSIREFADDAVVLLKNSNRKRSLREQREKQQRRSIEFSKSNALKKRASYEDVKKRSAANRESFGQIPSKEFFKKKRDSVRQMILVNNDYHQAKKRHSRSYPSLSEQRDVKLRNVLSINQNLDSYLYPDNRMASLTLANKDENKEGEQSSAIAKRPNPLVSLTASSQELSPRLAMEYKEAFGGLQSEPGSALARYKRIKRVLDRTDAKI